MQPRGQFSEENAGRFLFFFYGNNTIFLRKIGPRRKRLSEHLIKVNFEIEIDDTSALKSISRSHIGAFDAEKSKFFHLPFLSRIFFWLAKEKRWTRTDKKSRIGNVTYNPVFHVLFDMPVEKKNIYLSGTCASKHYFALLIQIE